MNYDRWEKLGDVELLEEVFYEHGWIAFIQELTRIYEEAMANDIQVSPGSSIKLFHFWKI